MHEHIDTQPVAILVAFLSKWCSQKQIMLAVYNQMLITKQFKPIWSLKTDFLYPSLERNIVLSV